MNLTEEQKIQNIERVNKLIETFPDDRRKTVRKMMEGRVGEMYFTAPASSRDSFHNAFPGGLCAHSLNVVANLWRLVKDLAPDKWPKHKLAFVGLFHDLGKVGDGENERYIPNVNDFQRREYGRVYVTNEKLRWMTTADAGLYLLQSHSVTLDFDEWLAIKLNDGMYAAENREYGMKEPDLAMFIHWADVYSTRAEKL